MAGSGRAAHLGEDTVEHDDDFLGPGVVRATEDIPPIRLQVLHTSVTRVEEGCGGGQTGKTGKGGGGEGRMEEGWKGGKD